MKRFLFISISLLLMNIHSFGQSKWINVYYPDRDAIGKNITNSYDKGIVLVGKHGHNSVNFNWLIKTNINGEILWEKAIGDYSTNLMISDLSYNNMGELFLAGLTGFYNNYDYDPIVLKLNPCGEKEWCKVFKAEGNNFINVIKVKSDGSCVVILRYMNPDHTQDRICLAELSSGGELEWLKCYNSSDPRLYNEDAYDITLCLDKGYLITGDCYYQDSNPPHYLWLKPYYIKTDSLGNFEWETVVNTETNLPGGSAWSTVLNPDSTYFYSSISHYLTTSDNAPALVKIDLTGNVIGIYDLAPPNYYGKLFEFVFISDSTMAGSAVWGNEYNSSPKAIIFDTLGNILDSAYLLDNNYMSYVRKTFDGKLLFFTNHYDEETDQFDAHLFKLNQQLEDDTLYTYLFQYDTLCPYSIDSDTIVQDCCDIIVSIEEEEEEMGRDGDGERMVLYPNPASDRINCRLSVVDCRYSIFIYDMFGRKQEEIQIPTGQKEIQIDVSDYPQGIYIAVLRSEREILDRKKFVVSR